MQASEAAEGMNKDATAQSQPDEKVPPEEAALQAAEATARANKLRFRQWLVLLLYQLLLRLVEASLRFESDEASMCTLPASSVASIGVHSMPNPIPESLAGMRSFCTPISF